MRKNIENAFSLMEMMVVLLIVAIIAAATAPMVTKKMMRNAGSGDSPWVFTGLGNSIAYNMNGNDGATAIIGNVSTPSGWNRRARLFIDSGNNAAHIAFGNGNATPLLLTADPQFGRIGFSNDEIPSYSVAFGTGQTLEGEYTVAIGNGVRLNNAPQGAVAIGDEVVSNGSQYTVAIGVRAEAAGNNSIAIGGMTGNEYTSAASNGIALGTGTKASGNSSIALGLQAKVTGEGAITVGNSAYGGGNKSIAIGRSAKAEGTNSISIGNNAGTPLLNGTTTKINSISVGNLTTAAGKGAIAIGDQATASGEKSIAIGPYGENGKMTTASHTYSVAIGSGAQTTSTYQIVLGTANDTVYIPGNLRVDGNVELGVNSNKYVALRINEGLSDGGGWNYFGRPAFKDGDYSGHRIITLPNNTCGAQLKSDRRLKNVGEKYTAGLDELKKLDFYHYTFKKDEAKTPMVGVMAQDLQKVFPDAVTKGEDGYLRIRLEDMFYAVINAVKELDNKISEIVADITSIKTTIKSQQETIDSLQKENAELKEEIKSIEKRIEKLEK